MPSQPKRFLCRWGISNRLLKESVPSRVWEGRVFTRALQHRKKISRAPSACGELSPRHSSTQKMRSPFVILRALCGWRFFPNLNRKPRSSPLPVIP
jgi:hypothetical protein